MLRLNMFEALVQVVVVASSRPSILVFNQLADQRDELLREVLSEEEYEQFVAAKHRMMHTRPDSDEP